MKKILTFFAAMLIGITAINAEDLYLRGGVNGWNASNDYKFADNGDGTFTLNKTFDLEGEFKFADANWGSVLNFGSSEKATCSEQGVTINLVTNGANISTDGKLSLTKIVVDKNQKKATFFGTKGTASDGVYTIAGQSALVGVDWDPSATINDMTDMKDGTYQLVKEDISLAVGNYEYKAVKNHAWGIWECPSGNNNNTLTISEAGTYTVTFTLTPATSTLVANAVKSGEPQPVETKYYAKNNWDGAAADDWSWLEMSATDQENIYMLDSVVFGGTGVNLNTKEDDADAKWFDLKKMKYNEQDTIQALDTVRFELSISDKDTVLTAIKLGRPAPAPRKEFTFIAGEAADSDPALFAITWGKDGSNETVKLANKADDIYTAEILETVDSLVLVRCATGATEIIWDGEGKNIWNQTANYALCDTMYFESWVPETNLFAVTCEAPKPVEVKYYLKNNWNGAAEWSWKEMTKEEEAYVLDSVIFGGTGVNLNTKEDDADAKWFDLKKMKYNEQDTIQALDTVRFELSISDKDTVLTAIKLGRPAPVARKEFVFVAGEAAGSDPAMFAITWGKDGSSETVKMEKQEEALYVADILATVDSVVLVRCATGATEIIWDGEGKNIWNQTANYALCDTMYFESWVPETNLFAVTCEAPKPVEVKYYLKNNWNGAAEWSWKEMTKEEEAYVLDSVIFGGTGVNLNTKEDDADAKWFDLKKMKYNEQDTIQALDTVRFELSISDKDTVLTAIKLGRPAPVARKEFVFVAGEAADSDPAMFAITWGKDGSNETVKLANKADDIYTAEILETVDSLVLVRCATGATEIIWDGEGKNIWNQTANYALCDTMYFESWVPETNLFAVTCEAPKPVEVKYYLKNNWNGAAEWSWKEMTKKEEAYVLDSVIFGGTGVNLNTKEDDADAKWFDLKKMKYNEQDTIQALDTVRFELSISDKDTVLTAIKLGRPAPVARKEFTFIAGEAADSDPALFAITWGKDGSSETVKMEKQEETLYAADILATVDSVVLVRCATGATEIIWDGEGKNIWNQTANYALCDTMYFESWVPETNLFAVTCEAPQPVATKYYAKNNWGGATEWSWLEMSATDQENFYMLDSVVFGGTGVNINDKEDDTDALWFAADAITVLDDLDGLPGPIPPEPRKRDTIPYAPAHSGVVLETPQLLAGDTIKLFFNAADSTLKAFIVGRPQPVEQKFYVTGNAALVGEEKAWQADAIEMVDYTHTFPMLAAGEYQLKVTDGTWEHAWGYDNLSPTVAVEGLYTDVDGNICFTVYTPNDVTVTFAQGYVVVTGDFKNPQPADEGFGIILSDGSTIKGQKNEGQVEFEEYVTVADLTAGATFQLYDFANEAAWTVDNIDEASTPNLTINEDYVYEVTADGKYTIYLKMYGMGNDQVYCAYEGTGTNLNKVKAAQGQRFNVLGLPVNANYRGVVIMNGQTYLQ